MSPLGAQRRIWSTSDCLTVALQFYPPVAFWQLALVTHQVGFLKELEALTTSFFKVMHPIL